MKKVYVIFLLVLLLEMNLFSQNPVDITDQTMKLGGNKEEKIYIGFAEGDKLIFNFQEVNDKELKEIEIIEYPSNSKFSDYKTSKILNKEINIIKKGVYIFRFKNSALGGRICKIRIQRIPANDDTKNFNTSVNWTTKQDTTWNTYTEDIVIGYDTVYTKKTKKELIKIDTIITPILDKVLRVHSGTAIGKTQYNEVKFELPENSYYPNQLFTYKSTEVLAWSYWLGVGQKANAEYEKANKNIETGIKTLGVITGYGALAQLAITGISIFNSANIGDNVNYKIITTKNEQAVIVDEGNVVSASGRNEKIKQGQFLISLYNDNIRDGIDVTVKIIAIQIIKIWDDVNYTEQNLVPKTEKRFFREPIINTCQIPVIVE